MRVVFRAGAFFAAVFLAGQARKVYLAVRADDLDKNMSSYLARRIEQTPNVEVLLDTEVARMRGDGHLSEVELVNKKTGQRRTIPAPGLFSFIGAVPRTGWLPQINTGMAGRVAGTGQVGAGLVQPPQECFEQALATLAEGARAA